MISSLSILTDYLVECLHKGKCKDYKSSLEHMTANDSLLAFRCMDCSKAWGKFIKEVQKHVSFVIETLANFVLCCEKLFTHMSMWMPRKDSVKHQYSQRRNSTAT